MNDSVAPIVSPPHVVVVGAGAAGITAAFALVQAGVDVTILEASPSRIGGRIYPNTTLSAFPLELGGEWVHLKPDQILPRLLSPQRDFVVGPQQTLLHDTGPIQYWSEDTFYPYEFDPVDYLWVNTSWLEFFETNFIEPASLADRIVMNCAVDTIDVQAPTANDTGHVLVSCATGDKTYTADAVIVTASMKVLQDGVIKFQPPLPDSYRNAMGNFDMGPGLKVFIEFTETFYPLAFAFESDDATEEEGERYFYDATFGETTNKHILGVFAYGITAERYLALSVQGEDVLVRAILEDLDAIFDGRASATYVNHVVQDWAQEPFVRCAYTYWITDYASSIAQFQKPVHGKVFFAGEALPPDLENWGFVHGAALSGQKAAADVVAFLDSAGTSADVFGVGIAAVWTLLLWLF
jgi:monoamine oxidase